MLPVVEIQDAAPYLTRKQTRLDEAEETVRPILKAVRDRGDAAVIEYARRFDGFEGVSLAVPRQECEAALAAWPRAFRDAVERASANIHEYALTQLPPETAHEFSPGRRLGQIVRPLDSMAAYVPAGRYPLPSTALMTVVPAQAAGVRSAYIASPKPSPEILGIAALRGVAGVWRVGGAHAIAALAYGTETIPRIDRIVGPGNIYVAAAKKLLAGEVGIDFVAGPTEILIITADGDPRWLAADMLAQAEHDVDAASILLTTSRSLARAVSEEVERQLATLPTAAVARQAIDRNSAAIVVGTLEQAVEFSNRFAPEHLALHDSSLLAAIRHAGSVFLGASSPEAAGDYASGPNHVLPTSGAARITGGLSAAHFVKTISVQELSLPALADLQPAISALARAEGLEAHARSVEVRLA